MPELDAGVLGCELPVYGPAQGIARVHPGLELGPQRGRAFDAPVQALCGQGRELEFGDAGWLPCLGV